MKNLVAITICSPMSTNVSGNSTAFIFNVRENILPTEEHIILYYRENLLISRDLMFSVCTLCLKRYSQGQSVHDVCRICMSGVKAR